MIVASRRVALPLHNQGRVSRSRIAVALASASLLATACAIAPPPPEPSAAEGRRLFTEHGCYGCHTVLGTGTPIAPDLSRIGHKYSESNWFGAFVTRRCTNWARICRSSADPDGDPSACRLPHHAAMSGRLAGLRPTMIYGVGLLAIGCAGAPHRYAWQPPIPVAAADWEACHIHADDVAQRRYDRYMEMLDIAGPFGGPFGGCPLGSTRGRSARTSTRGRCSNVSARAATTCGRRGNRPGSDEGPRPELRQLLGEVPARRAGGAGRVRRPLRGLVKRIGAEAVTTVDVDGAPAVRERAAIRDHAAAVHRCVEAVRAAGLPVDAVGHRVVHGGDRFSQPVLLDEAAEAAIEELLPGAGRRGAAAGLARTRHRLGTTRRSLGGHDGFRRPRVRRRCGRPPRGRGGPEPCSPRHQCRDPARRVAP
jgi:hypothetical protein